MKGKKLNWKDKEECKACKALRKGLTWIGDPPKCHKHRSIKMTRYYGSNQP